MSFLLVLGLSIVGILVLLIVIGLIIEAGIFFGIW